MRQAGLTAKNSRIFVENNNNDNNRSAFCVNQQTTNEKQNSATKWPRKSFRSCSSPGTEYALANNECKINKINGR